MYAYVALTVFVVQMREIEERRNAFYNGHYVLPAMPTGSTYTSLGPIIALITNQICANSVFTLLDTNNCEMGLFVLKLDLLGITCIQI